MKKLLLLPFALLSMAALAQQPDMPKGNGKITGIVLDSLDNAPVQFATIALNNPATNKPIDGAVADDKGKFTLTKVANGNWDDYFFVGYTTKTFHVTLTDKKTRWTWQH